MKGSEQIFKIFKKFNSIIKENNFFRFSSIIVLPFIFKIISKFYKDKIDEKLIIMGGSGGRAFLDNTKYLFQFLNENSEYKLVWITKLSEIYKELEKKGYNVIPYYSLKSIRLLRKAKYIFFTHYGLVDVLPIEFSPKTTIIFTWHGTPIKKMYSDLDKTQIYRKWASILRLKLKSDQYIDYLLTPTKTKRERMILSSLFMISPKKILELGYPRNDILFNINEEFVKKLRKQYKIQKDIKKVILYCPTWRSFDSALEIPFTSDELEELHRYIKETDTIFLIKAHFHYFKTKMNINKNYENIRIVPEHADIQELYLITDILITDYSSAMFDFSLLDRPILLYPYDLEKYSKNPGLYYDLEEIAPGPIFLNFDDLMNGIINIIEYNKEYEEKRKLIRNEFNKFVDGNSTKRLLDFLNITFETK